MKTRVGPMVALGAALLLGTVAAADSSLDHPIEVVAVDATHWRVDRADVAVYLDAPGFRHARLVPTFKDGKQDGLRLFSIRPDSNAARLGFQNGDVVKSIGKRPLVGPAETMEAIAKLRATLPKLTSIPVEIERKGARLERVYLLN